MTPDTRKWKIALLLCIISLSLSHGLYVIMSENAPKCFRVEVPIDTLVVGTFISEPLFNPWDIGQSAVGEVARRHEVDIQREFDDKHLGMEVIVKDNNERVVMDRVYEHSSRFAFTSLYGGEYGVCLLSNTTAWWDSIHWKMSIEINTGANANDYKSIAKKEHLNSMEVWVRKLYDRSQSIRSELMYQKMREMEFREISDSTNSRAMWWSVFQLLIVIGAAVWQMQHLRSFFRKRKLI